VRFHGVRFLGVRFLGVRFHGVRFHGVETPHGCDVSTSPHGCATAHIARHAQGIVFPFASSCATDSFGHAYTTAVMPVMLVIA
jgi:hypothetical protein